ncbi:unnamed protein product [Paramecium octaurelia]|uniref:Uncharacterized protein n=1 Tax=Paramecium octaurelia TaxID=43137 RepID=A0A8S1UN54_PAROT|nr:unnamed protein product [Paramecium octaurelia]
MVLRQHRSLAINKFQKLIIKRCQQPLLNLQEESRIMKKSSIQQPSLLFTNKRFEHLRYHSQKTQNLTEKEVSTRMQDKFESTQKDSNRNEKIQYPQFEAFENQIKESAQF